MTGRAAPTDRGPFARFVQETRGQTVRSLRRMRREPFSLLFALVQPVILLVFLGGAFRTLGARLAPGGNYDSFMLPGILALTVFGSSMSGGIPLLFDKESGFLSRLVAAPITRSSIFVSQFLTVHVVSTLQCLVMMAVAFLLGARVATGPAGVAALLGFGLMLGFGVTMISLVLAFLLRGHGDFFALLGVITLPLIFLSTAFVTREAMPGWMQIAAALNPMTWAIDAMRSLVFGDWDAAGLLRGAAGLGIFDAVMLAAGALTLRRRI